MKRDGEETKYSNHFKNKAGGEMVIGWWLFETDLRQFGQSMTVPESPVQFKLGHTFSTFCA